MNALHANYMRCSGLLRSFTLSEQVDWKAIREKAGPFPPQAYQFVRDGLAHTSRMAHGELEASPGASRHVSGQQLCLGLRDYAIRQYGAMARTVLEEHLRFPAHLIEAQLAHTVRDANGRAYNRTTHIEERRVMMQKWADYLEALTGPNVLPFTHAQRSNS